MSKISKALDYDEIAKILHDNPDDSSGASTTPTVRICKALGLDPARTTFNDYPTVKSMLVIGEEVEE